MGESPSTTMTSGRSRHSSEAGDNEPMRPRLIASLILGIVTLPVLFVGLIDPLEGGIALLVALGLGVGVRLLSGVPLPRLTWIPLLATIAVGALALILAMAGMPSDTVQEVGPDATAPNPLSAGVRLLVWVYRLGVLVVLVGGVVYLVRIGRALGAASRQREEEVAQ